MAVPAAPSEHGKCRLLAAHGRRNEAKAGLVLVVASITEGFADGDFKQAAALLSQFG